MKYLLLVILLILQGYYLKKSVTLEKPKIKVETEDTTVIFDDLQKAIDLIPAVYGESNTEPRREAHAMGDGFYLSKMFDMCCNEHSPDSNGLDSIAVEGIETFKQIARLGVYLSEDGTIDTAYDMSWNEDYRYFIHDEYVLEMYQGGGFDTLWRGGK